MSKNIGIAPLREKKNAVALPQKCDHRSSLNALHYIAISTELILPAARKAVHKNKGHQKNINECIKLCFTILSSENDLLEYRTTVIVTT